MLNNNKGNKMKTIRLFLLTILCVLLLAGCTEKEPPENVILYEEESETIEIEVEEAAEISSEYIV